MKFRLSARALALALTVLGLPAPAHAVSSPPIEHLTGEEMQALLQAWGYTSGDLSTDDTGDPQIQFPMAGVHPYISFYNCAKISDTGPKTCQSIGISIGFSAKDLPAIAKVNEWNEKYRYSTAYLRANNDPYIRYDILLTGGISTATLKEYFQLFEGRLKEFLVFIGWK